MEKKFRAIHLLSGIDSERVRRSVSDVSFLQNFGIEYRQIHNDLYDQLPPKETCLRPHAVSVDPGGKETKYGFEWNLTPRSYGCYLAHKNGVLENFSDDLDGLLIFECDAVCCVDLDEFYERLCRLDYLCKKYREIFVATLGHRHNGLTFEKIEELDVVQYFIESHAYYVPIGSRGELFDIFRTRPWDTIDVFINHWCTILHLKVALFNDRPIWTQAFGTSYLQGDYKDAEDHYKRARYRLGKGEKVNFYPIDLCAARKIVPILIKEFNPKSVLDLGCNNGYWLAEFEKAGVSDVMGVDCEDMISELVINKESFRVFDLALELNLGRKYDMVLCLEVAEHLKEDHAEMLVRNICKHGNLVVFSAAIPGQGGYNHVNEKPIAYWVAMFSRWTYTADERFRGKITDNVSGWYKNNTVVYRGEYV